MSYRYRQTYKPRHPRANLNGCVKDHRLVAEKALGKVLPRRAVVHHVNDDTTDNRPENLVICENHSYHRLLHHRRNAFRACGNAAWRKCLFCKGYDALENLYLTSSRQRYHRRCRNAHRPSRSKR